MGCGLATNNLNIEAKVCAPAYKQSFTTHPSKEGDFHVQSSTQDDENRYPSCNECFINKTSPIDIAKDLPSIKC